MRVACHQPYFLPPLSFFAKWAAADALVLLDELQFVGSSAKFHYANRTKLGDDKWYTVPVAQRLGQRICDLQPTDQWQPQSLLGRIRNDYRGTPFLRPLLAAFEQTLTNWDRRNLGTLNINFLRWAGAALGIQQPLYVQSELAAYDGEDRDERLAALVKAVGGDVYVAGPSGPNYMLADVYARAGVALEVCHFDPRPYSRGTRPWTPYLSVVDAYCYHGPDTATYLTAELQPWAAQLAAARGA